MKIITVDLPQNPYEIRIGSGLLSEVGKKLKGLDFKGQAVIVTNPVVSDYYGEALRDSLIKEDFRPVFLVVPDGEDRKSLEQAGQLFSQMNELQAERLTPVLSLGGGVIGDLAGFVAATYMRGVPLVHVPTTLLAQVDSSIGGKVAINHGQFKNIIGAFYQPRLVVSDTSLFRTLPPEEIRNGLAEVIKYGIISDSGLFSLIESHIDPIIPLDENLGEEIVFRCASIKARIIEKDEHDQGLRNILNYGHTVGHGVETVSGYAVSHGQAVAIGMIAAALISHHLGFLPGSELERIKSIIQKVGLPVKIPGPDIQSLIQALQHDKKKVGGNLRLVLPEKIGKVFIQEGVSRSLLEQVLEELA
jgi:3-dehydroquinate synthase